jgi:hypothetical protein
VCLITIYNSPQKGNTAIFTYTVLTMIDFQQYVKHLRFYNNELYEYHHKEVERRFYETLKVLGESDESDNLVFITLRLKGKSDWVVANNASNALEFKLSKYFWGRKSRHRKLPYVSSIETSLKRFKDHIHAIVRLTELKQDYTLEEIEDSINNIALNLEEVNQRNPDAVRIRIFPFCGESYEVGNSIEYICKTSSKHYNPIARKILSKEHQEEIKTQL